MFISTFTQLLTSGGRSLLLSFFKVQCCVTSTETIRTIRDGVLRTATSTLTQLLSSEKRPERLERALEGTPPPPRPLIPYVLYNVLRCQKPKGILLGTLSLINRMRFMSTLRQSSSASLFTQLRNSDNVLSLLSCCFTSTQASWPIRDGDRVGKGRESERLDRGNRPKKTGETVDRRQNNGSVKAVSPRHCPATCALCNCSFNCCAGQSH